MCLDTRFGTTRAIGRIAGAALRSHLIGQPNGRPGDTKDHLVPEPRRHRPWSSCHEEPTLISVTSSGTAPQYRLQKFHIQIFLALHAQLSFFRTVTPPSSQVPTSRPQKMFSGALARSPRREGIAPQKCCAYDGMVWVSAMFLSTEASLHGAARRHVRSNRINEVRSLSPATGRNSVLSGCRPPPSACSP